MMKCIKCETEFTQTKDVTVTNCPLCQAKIEVEDMQTPKQKMKFINANYHINEVYNSAFSFCDIIDENFKDKEDYTARLLKFLTINNANKLVLKLKDLPKDNIKVEFDKIVNELEYNTFISPEILTPAVTLLCIGLGIEIEEYEKTSSLIDFEIDNGELKKYLGNENFVDIPNSVTSIGDFAFYGSCYLTKVKLPNSLTSIGESAFDSCDFLKQITLPKSLTSISEFAFADCTELHEINIPNSFISIDRSAFRNCSNLPNDVKQQIISINPKALN